MAKLGSALLGSKPWTEAPTVTWEALYGQQPIHGIHRPKGLHQGSCARIRGSFLLLIHRCANISISSVIILTQTSTAMKASTFAVVLVALLTAAAVPAALGHPNRHLLQNRAHLPFTSC